MRVELACSAVLLSLAAGCNDPDTVVLIVGKVQDARGQPVSGQTVQLFREASSVQGGVEGEPLDAGTPRLLEEQQSDARGEFVFQVLSGVVAPPGGGYLQEFRLATLNEEPGGPQSAMTFRPSPSGDSLTPGLLLWNDVPALGVTPPELSLPALPEVPRTVVEAGIQPGQLPTESPQKVVGIDAKFDWELTRGDDVTWRSPMETGVLVATPYVLEDLADVRGRAVMGGDGTVLEVNTGSTWPLTARATTASVPVGSGSRIPVSRGAECTFDAELQAPCGLTDGQFTRVVGARGSLGLELSIRFAQPTLLGAFVVRGLSFSRDVDVEPKEDGTAAFIVPESTIFVEGSTDEQTWTVLATHVIPGERLDVQRGRPFDPEVFFEGSIDAATPAFRQVRVSVGRADDARLITAVRELSFFAR